MSAPTRKRLFLVDGYALVYRAFHAVGAKPMTTKRGENTSIPWGIANFIDRLRRSHAPDYLGWVHDAGLSNRDVTFAEYKATRVALEPEQKADFDRGVERVGALLQAHQIPLLRLPGFEADDVIATLARKAHHADVDVVVVSPDKDLLQLVGAGIRVLNPYYGKPGATTEKWYDEAGVVERLGVPPERVPDYLALVGDSSDNVPGVKGIGDKGARELIARWGTIEDLLAHVADVTPPRARTALEQHAADATMSKSLVTVRDDLGVDLDLNALALQSPDVAALRALYVELEFFSLARPLGEVTKQPVAVVSEVPVDYRVIDSVAGIATLVQRVRDTGSFAFSVGTEPEPGAPIVAGPLRANLVSLAIALRPGEAFYLPLAHRAPGAQKTLALGTDEVVVTNLPPLNDASLRVLVELFEDASVSKTAHNAKHDVLVLRRAGVNVRGISFDTMLASYLVDPGRRSHALDALAFEMLHHTLMSHEQLCGKGKSQISFAEAGVEAARDYACGNVDYVHRLHALLSPQLVEHRLDALLRELELPLLDVLAEMEWTGVAIDLEWFASLKARFRSEREKVEQRIWAEAGQQFNIQSNNELREILFDKLGLPVKKRTATGPSTDATVLQELADEGHTLPVLLMDFRELAKLESTYIDTLPTLVNPRTQRLHTSYSQTVAATGRLSSSDPNLQNIPIRTEVGRDIRRGFVPRAGWTFLTADYSQIELRLLAHLSQDPAFVSAFRAGGDIHRQTAAVIFGVAIDAVVPEMRARAKTINFATIYGQGPFSLSRQLRISGDEARAFIDTYFERFAGVRRFLDECVATARERGYTETIFGRRRYIPELRDRNFNIRAFGERVAQNSPIQGSAADLIKRAMLLIADSMRTQRMQSAMLLQVHDELVFEVAREELPALQPVVVNAMTSAADLSVPLIVDIGVGNNWVEAKAHG
ncbi:MAG TPA: DNA polymerase I [Gemmatimonadaceae bacterium]|nr:DNA polymerase I [Gemmatimonadaceae bacterium]